MTLTAIPADLLAIEEETLLGADYGAFETMGKDLNWCARWVGDAPGDEPKDTTHEVMIEAMRKVRELGYEVGDTYNDHDTALFRVLPKVKE